MQKGYCHEPMKTASSQSLIITGVLNQGEISAFKVGDSDHS